MPLKHVPSTGDLSSESGSNKFMMWFDGPTMKTIYVLGIIFCGLLLSSLFDNATGWTLTHLVHNLVTYIVLHQITGLPLDDVWCNQGIMDRYTIWEQIDHGTNYSKVKKMLTIFPIILCMIAVHESNYSLWLSIFNYTCLVPVIAPKMSGILG